jgi:hypothetical protein
LNWCSLPPIRFFEHSPFLGGRAQRILDLKQAALAAYAHFKSLTQAELLLPGVRSGDAEAQYWVASKYEEGWLVPKDFRQNAARFLENPSK